MSAEPQSRGVLDGHSNGLIAQYDTHLRVLGDRYLFFFRERKKIEEIYVNSLRKLYHKAKAVDASFDSIEPNTTRVAWNEVRDNLERETRTRQVFVNTLATDVINPLATLKDTQDRARKRVKDDLKESAAAYADYAENTLPKLKRAYFRKCQEYEDLSLASTQSQGAGQSPSLLEPPRTHDGKLGTLSRYRTLSTARSFSDLAQHGKKQLNQFITRLDRDGSIRGGNVDPAARLVRAKQEAEAADDEYRKAIHCLCGLRLQRAKVLEDGHNVSPFLQKRSMTRTSSLQNLERIAFETTETVKKVLVKYADTTVTICTMHNDLATDARSAVENISAETDTSILVASLRSSLALSIPPRTLYHNYDVGECPDLVFGLSLADYATARGVQNDLPKILRLCIEEVEKRGLEAEGIYTLSRQHAHVQELQRKVERDEKAFSFNSDTDDIYTVASLLKLYLKVLPEPLFSFQLQDRIQHSRDLASHTANGFVLLRSKIHGLPAVHRTSLEALLWHLSHVASHSNKNGMDSKNLAFVFTPIVFGSDEVLQGGFGQSMQDSVMETLIDNAHILLDERPPFSSPSPPPIYPRGRTPVMDDDSSATSTISFSRFEDITPQRSPQSSSPTRSPGSSYASTLSTPPMSPSGSSVYEDLSGGHTPTQAPAPAPWLPQLPDFPELQIFTEFAGSELPVRVRVFPDDATGKDVADRTPNLRPQPAGSTFTPDLSNLSIPHPRSAVASPRRGSPAQATLRPSTPDISSLRTFTETERLSQEQDVTRLGANAGVRSRNPSEVSLVPSLPRFAPQQQRQQRRPPPLSIPGTESTRTTITDHRRSSATSLASGNFAFPGSFNDS
ncbi:hypothetical protein EDB87DRAFT_1832895 [Lactarius vividus]|nr:hypothetical protein EDB87DRAFT_1832895 [Lactarius vividus]